MGNYLDTVNNRKAAGTRQPNENYAREILQLFSIGLWELHDDGTLLLDAFGNPVPTYDQADITELSRVYTGWVYPPLPGQTPALERDGQLSRADGPRWRPSTTPARNGSSTSGRRAAMTRRRWDVTNANTRDLHPSERRAVRRASS